VPASAPSGTARAGRRGDEAGRELDPDLVTLFPGQAALASDAAILRQPQDKLIGQFADGIMKNQLGAGIGHISERALDQGRSVGNIDPDPLLQEFTFIFSLFGMHG